MVIQALGENSFRIDSGDRSILVNPPSGRFKANITLLSETKHVDIIPTFGVTVVDEGVVIKTPGEYNAQGIDVRGVETPDSTEMVLKTAYLVSWEDINLLIFSSATLPNTEALEELDSPDVVLLAVGGTGLSSERAHELVKKLEPKIVVLSSAGKTKDFLNTMGQKGETAEKLVFKKKDLEQEKSRIVILSIA